MKRMRGGNPRFDIGPDNGGWDNNDPKPNFGNFRSALFFYSYRQQTVLNIL